LFSHARTNVVFSVVVPKVPCLSLEEISMREQLEIIVFVRIILYGTIPISIG